MKKIYMTTQYILLSCSTKARKHCFIILINPDNKKSDEFHQAFYYIDVSRSCQSIEPIFPAFRPPATHNDALCTESGK